MSRKLAGYFTLCMLTTAPLSGHGAPTYIELVNKSGIPLHAPKVFVTKKAREGGSSGPAPCANWNHLKLQNGAKVKAQCAQNYLDSVLDWPFVKFSLSYGCEPVDGRETNWGAYYPLTAWRPANGGWYDFRQKSNGAKPPVNGRTIRLTITTVHDQTLPNYCKPSFVPRKMKSAG